MAETCKQDLTLDPISLILSQNSRSTAPLRLTTTDSYFMERGPRYTAYAQLRESKLRMKQLTQQQREFEEEFEYEEPKITPRKKQVRFQEKPVLGHRSSSTSRSSSVLAQSVPDFSSALRKENRKPANAMELTPPTKTKSKIIGVSGNARGSVSASAGEKRGNRGGLMGRKSYASIEELRGMSSAAGNAIVGENRRSGRVIGKTAVLGYRQF